MTDPCACRIDRASRYATRLIELPRELAEDAQRVERRDRLVGVSPEDLARLVERSFEAGACGVEIAEDAVEVAQRDLCRETNRLDRGHCVAGVGRHDVNRALCLGTRFGELAAAFERCRQGQSRVADVRMIGAASAARTSIACAARCELGPAGRHRGRASPR